MTDINGTAHRHLAATRSNPELWEDFRLELILPSEAEGRPVVGEQMPLAGLPASPSVTLHVEGEWQPAPTIPTIKGRYGEVTLTFAGTVACLAPLMDGDRISGWRTVELIVASLLAIRTTWVVGTTIEESMTLQNAIDAARAGRSKYTDAYGNSVDQQR